MADFLQKASMELCALGAGLSLCNGRKRSDGLEMCLNRQDRNYHYLVHGRQLFRTNCSSSDALCALRPSSAMSRTEGLLVQQRKLSPMIACLISGICLSVLEGALCLFQNGV